MNAPASFCLPHPEATTLAGIDITTALRERPPRPPDLAAENAALVRLASQLATSPATLLNQLVECARSLCGAHSAGISLLEDSDGQAVFRWHAIAGQWRQYVGGTMPRALSPCGTVLDRDGPVLLQRLGRYYPVPPSLQPGVEEALLIPFRAGGTVVGTLWLIAHDDTVQFDAEDERVLTNLGVFAASAYQALKAGEAVRLNEKRYRTLVHATANSVWRMSGDGASMLELSSSVAAPHPASCGPSADWLRTYVPAEEHQRLKEDWARAVARRTLYEHQHRAIAATGELRTWLSRAVPLMEPDGSVREWMGASVDITDRLTAEDALRQTLSELEMRVAARTAELTQVNARLRLEVEQRRTAERNCTEAARRLADAVEAERARFSRELHDEIGQQLTSLAIELAAAGRSASAADLPARIAGLQQRVDQIAKAIHDVAVELRPSGLDHGGLGAALTSYLADWTRRTGVRVDLHETVGQARLPASVEMAAYRIVQESFTNIARHASARTASVVVDLREREILLIVEDDGCGFDPAILATDEKARRLGLVGIRERVALLQGRIELETAPGRGTALFCYLPLYLSAPAHEQT